MSFHMCTMLWHYPQKYTEVWVTRSPLFGSDVSYEQAHCPCLSPLRTVHLSFSGESTTPKVDFQSPSMPHLSLSAWSQTVLYHSDTIQIYADVSGLVQPPLLCPLCDVRTSLGCDNIYPLCLSWGFAGL